MDRIKKTFSQIVDNSSFFYNYFGAFVAAISCYNIYVAYTKTPISIIVSSTLAAYRALSHGAFDLIFFWLPVLVPAVAKDVFIVYLVIGGAVARLRSVVRLPSYEARGIKLALGCLFLDRPLYSAIGGGYPMDYYSYFSRNRFTKFYACMPDTVRILMDIFFWPLWMRQIWKNNLIFIKDHGDETFTFKVVDRDITDGERIRLVANRRTLLAAQLIMIVLWLAIISILNAYSLGVP
jgi:hypothetical protein